MGVCQNKGLLAPKGYAGIIKREIMSIVIGNYVGTSLGSSPYHPELSTHKIGLCEIYAFATSQVITALGVNLNALRIATHQCLSCLIMNIVATVAALALTYCLNPHQNPRPAPFNITLLPKPYSSSPTQKYSCLAANPLTFKPQA